VTTCGARIELMVNKYEEQKNTQKVILLVILGITNSRITALSWFHFAIPGHNIPGIPKT
jgi:hypothetical protein